MSRSRRSASCQARSDGSTAATPRHRGRVVRHVAAGPEPDLHHLAGQPGADPLPQRAGGPLAERRGRRSSGAPGPRTSPSASMPAHTGPVDRPLLLLDVDGVLNPYGDECPAGFTEHVLFPEEIEPVRVCAGHGAWIAELAGVVRGRLGDGLGRGGQPAAGSAARGAAAAGACRSRRCRSRPISRCRRSTRWPATGRRPGSTTCSARPGTGPRLAAPTLLPAAPTSAACPVDRDGRPVGPAPSPSRRSALRVGPVSGDRGRTTRSPGSGP